MTVLSLRKILTTECWNQRMKQNISETINVNCSAPGMTLLPIMACNQEAPDMKPSWGLANMIFCCFFSVFLCKCQYSTLNKTSASSQIPRVTCYVSVSHVMLQYRCNRQIVARYMKIFFALPFYALPYLAFTKRLTFYIKYSMNEKPCPESQIA
jgi:hypothetical protein